jgi:hypothetical protein
MEIFGFIVIITVVFLYFAPSIVAGRRQHRNGAAIAILNLLLGWTFIGWVIALAWACTNQDR